MFKYFFCLFMMFVPSLCFGYFATYDEASSYGFPHKKIKCVNTIRSEDGEYLGRYVSTIGLQYGPTCDIKYYSVWPVVYYQWNIRDDPFSSIRITNLVDIYRNGGAAACTWGIDGLSDVKEILALDGWSQEKLAKVVSFSKPYNDSLFSWFAIYYSVHYEGTPEEEIRYHAIANSSGDIAYPYWAANRQFFGEDLAAAQAYDALSTDSLDYLNPDFPFNADLYAGLGDDRFQLRFQSFLDNLKTSAFFSSLLSGCEVPTSAVSSFGLSFGRWGSGVFDFSDISGFLTALRLSLVVVFGWVGLRVIISGGDE